MIDVIATKIAINNNLISDTIRIPVFEYKPVNFKSTLLDNVVKEKMVSCVAKS